MARRFTFHIVLPTCKARETCQAVSTSAAAKNSANQESCSRKCIIGHRGRRHSVGLKLLEIDIIQYPYSIRTVEYSRVEWIRSRDIYLDGCGRLSF